MLEEILDSNQTFQIDFRGFFSNHLAHGAISLFFFSLFPAGRRERAVPELRTALHEVARKSCFSPLQPALKVAHQLRKLRAPPQQRAEGALNMAERRRGRARPTRFFSLFDSTPSPRGGRGGREGSVSALLRTHYPVLVAGTAQPCISTSTWAGR